MYDNILTDFLRYDNEKSDSSRIQRAINSSENQILYIPKGDYSIDEPLFIKNKCSLKMHPAARLIATKKMDFVLTYDGNDNFSKLSLFNEDGSIYDNLGLFIEGGDIDGNGLASCFKITNAHHFTLKDITFHNGLKCGMYAFSDVKNRIYELMCYNIYCKCTMKGLSGNIGILSETCDCHFTDCVIVDYTIGIRDFGGANRFTRCHIWGGTVAPKNLSMKEWSDIYFERKKEFMAGVYEIKDVTFENDIPEMLIDSISFDIKGECDVLDGCYADTANIGYFIENSAVIMNSGFFNNVLMGLNEATAINHTKGLLRVISCDFRGFGGKEKLYEGIQKDVDWKCNLVKGKNMITPDFFS